MLELRNITKKYSTRNGSRVVIDDLNLQINRSERLGILGRNGAGKSTLIRLIGGSELPTSGTIQRGMSVSWPLAFSGGFQGSLTGLDNLRFICRIYGVSYDDALPYVEEFSELGSYLREPVKKYSSGMCARLAFAISMAIEFECFLVDEVIAVGDANFQSKCRRELFEYRSDRAMLIVSHDPHLIREYCTKACVLEDGKLQIFPDVDSAFEHYDRQISKRSIVSVAPPHTLPERLAPIVDSDTTTPSQPLNFATPDTKLNSIFRDDQIIKAMYRTLLGREPDSQGLEHHVKLINQRPHEIAVEQTLELFLNSSESRNYRQSTTLINPVKGNEKSTEQAVHHIISFGTHCYTSALLKRFGLKKFSSAFDWIFSTPPMIAHAIEDDFRIFLDQNYYVPVPLQERRDGPEVNRVQHSYYQKDYGVEYMFNHHDVHEPADYAYLTRCVQRLRDSLKGETKSLVLLIRREDHQTQQEYALIRDVLGRVASQVALAFVAVARENSNTALPRVDSLEKSDRATLYRFTASSQWQTLEFVDPFDEICLMRTLFKDFNIASR